MAMIVAPHQPRMFLLARTTELVAKLFSHSISTVNATCACARARGRLIHACLCARALLLLTGIERSHRPKGKASEGRRGHRARRTGSHVSPIGMGVCVCARGGPAVGRRRRQAGEGAAWCSHEVWTMIGRNAMHACRFLRCIPPETISS